MDAQQQPDDTSSTPFTPQSRDHTLRLQDIISQWGGVQRGEALSTLHNQCTTVVGRQSMLLPLHLHLIPHLDLTNLRAAVKHLNGFGRSTTIQFRLAPTGRFDAALVPVGRAGTAPEHFLLVLDNSLPLQDQLALYGHAVGHLLLNHQEQQLGRRPSLDPRNAFAHADILAELRLGEATRQAIDRRVLEAFPLLTRLLEVPEESRAAFDVATSSLRKQLTEAGWLGQYLQMHHPLTAGRIYPSSSRRGNRIYLDALLRVYPSLPIAVVQTVRASQKREEATRLLQEHAHRLSVPFAYLLDEQNSIQEFDWSCSTEPSTSTLTTFPTREALWERWLEALHLTKQNHIRALRAPYRYSGTKIPRYYQEAAINAALVAVLQALEGLRPPRILLTLATGTGKTQVAFQLLWKLKRERAVRNILFLTDRDFLLNQAMENEFAPFADARYRIQGELSTAFDINFATYQGMTSLDPFDHVRYRSYPPNFFQVIVVDECHRGSANEASAWRKVLDYFSPAIHLGLTATPLSTETVQTDGYFGEPLYNYSLRMGINDGFLAPYRVRRVLIGQGAAEEPLTSAGEESAQEVQATIQVSLDEEESTPIAIPASMETPGTMRTYTTAIAHHLASFLHRTDPFAKTIVFCVDQAHAEDMRVALAEACASWISNTADYIVRIVSEEGAEGKRELGNFTTPDERFPVIVTTSKLLGTGIDVPTCKNIVLARPIGSMVEFKQIIGRGTRLFEPSKRWFTILDYAGTIKHFFDPTFDGDPELAEKETLIIEPTPTFQDDPAPFDETPPASNEAMAATPATSDTLETSGPSETGETSPSACSQQAESPAIEAATPASNQFYEPQGDYQQLEVSPSDASLSSPAHDASPFVSQQTDDGQLSETTPTANPSESAATMTSLPERAATPALSIKEQPAEILDPAHPPANVPIITKHTSSGRLFKVIGEIVFELEANGSTLRRGSYRDYTVSTMQHLVSTEADLRARWLQSEQRQEILNRLGEEGVDLTELAYSLHLTEVDWLDLLLHVVFHRPVITRAQRVERLRRQHTTFFKRYENTLLARAVLDVILDKYVKGEAPDVSDVGLLSVISLADRHTPFELARPFQDEATKANVRTVLKELQTLLYSV